MNNFDTTKYRLGNLCPRQHKWEGTEQSLRYIKCAGKCVTCNLLRATFEPRPTLEERFWSKVDKSGECWLWTGCKEKSGYGSFMLNGKRQKVHRIAWELAYGPIPDKLFVCHACDVRSCLRFDHLFLGTHTDNMRDMIAKKRDVHVLGVQNGRSKLTETEVKEIRKIYASGESNFTDLSKLFDVKAPTIANICKRITWRHIF